MEVARLNEGQWVLVEQSNGQERAVLLKPNTVVDLGRLGKLNTDSLIGLRSGLYYELLPGQKLSPISPADINPEINLEKEGKNGEEEEEMLTNEGIFDDNLAQKLTVEEIESLKALRESGEASSSMIVEKLIAGNENFEKKNKYSKEKYLKRKQQKFLKWICMRLCTTRLLAEHFAKRDPTRTMDLRVDTISQLIGHANIFTGGKYMIWDDSQGFVTGAILSRLSAGLTEDKESVLVSVHGKGTIQIPFLPYFNFSEADKQPLHALGLVDIGPEPLQPTPNHYNPSSEGNQEHLIKHLARWEERNNRRQRARTLCDNSSFTSLVIVCNESDPAALLDRLGRHLAPSGRLVIYSRYKETLLPAFIQARFSPNPSFVDVALTESWLRPYQTAAGRLHPEMSLVSSGAGFLLTATRVLNQ